MIHSRWKKIFREVWSRKTRTLLVSASIFIGVMGVITMFSMNQIVIGALESSIRRDKLAMIRVYVSLKSGSNAQDTAYLQTLSSLPEITDVEAMSLYPVSWKLSGGKRYNEGRIFAYSMSLSAVPLEPAELVKGRWPVAGQHEIVVERRLASAYGIKVNDPLVLRVVSGSIHEETWTVVGTAFQPYSYPILPGAPAQIPSNTMMFATEPDVQYITGLTGFSIIQARYKDYPTAQAQAGAFEAALAQQTPYSPSIRLIEDPAQNYLIERSRVFSNVLSLLAIVALAASGFLVFNVINTVVIEQRRQIGILKSLGATGQDNFFMYAGIALVYGLIGVVPGVLLGIPTGYFASAKITPQFNILLGGFTIAWRAVLIGILLGLIMPVLAAALPVLIGIRVTILEAITDMGIHATYGRGVLAWLIDALPLPVSLRQALRNVSQKKSRLALTIVALALAAGAFMGVYAAFSSFNTILNNVMNQIGVQITIGPGDKTQIEPARELIQQNISGIKAIEPGLSLAIEIEGYTPRKIGPGPAFMIASGLNPADPDVVKFHLRSGTAWKNDPNRHGVVISAPIADGLHVDTGGQLTLQTGGKKGTFEIIGVADYLFDTVWIRWDDLARLGGLTEGAPTPNRYMTSIQVDHKPATAIGVNDQAKLVLTFTAGEFLTPGQPGAMISTGMAADHGYKVGDRLALTSGENTREVPITGIFTIPPQFAQPGLTGDVIAINWEDLAKLEGKSLEGEPVPGGLQIVLDQKKPTGQQVTDKIDEINELLLAHGINANYTNWISSTEGITAEIRTAQLVLNIASLMIAAVGAIGLLSSLSMSVFERQKEIGVMRSVGATSTTIAFQFLVEGLIVGGIAWGLGVPLSYALDRNLITQFNFQHAAEGRYPPITLVLGLGSALVIATFASLWPSLAAARKTVSNILRYQ